MSTWILLVSDLLHVSPVYSLKLREGRPPFQIMYNVARDNEVGGTRIIDQPTFSSIQPRTRFQLHASEAARIYYEVKQIGDAAYPLQRHKEAIIPRSQRLLFEQQVLMRPSARFRNHNRLTYCLNDALTPHDNTADGLVQLSGTPPFQAHLSIKNLAASEVYHETVVLNDPTWKLNIPMYNFKSIGPHVVTIESIQDASGCEQAAPDPLFKSIWVDVAETAAIVPFDRKEHYCVGDVSRFQLEGTPPWTIGYVAFYGIVHCSADKLSSYRINGKSHTQEARVSPFSIIQQQPGEFAVTSIAHQQKMCKTAVTDLRYTVHPLPAAQVGHGKRIIQDIHEGS
jgi:nucleoporin POM152